MSTKPPLEGSADNGAQGAQEPAGAPRATTEVKSAKPKREKRGAPSAAVQALSKTLPYDAECAARMLKEYLDARPDVAGALNRLRTAALRRHLQTHEARDAGR